VHVLDAHQDPSIRSQGFHVIQGSGRHPEFSRDRDINFVADQSHDRKVMNGVSDALG
jgi:hypothetical protein